MSWGTPWAQRPGGPPRIDLLPRQLVEQRVVRRQRIGIGAGLLVLLTLLGGWYVLESRELGRAQDQADQERAVATGLRAQRAQLQPLATLESQIAASEQLRASVYKHEIRFSSVMRDISAIVPDDVWLTSMSVTFSDASGSGKGTGSTSSQAGGAAATVTPGSPGASSPVAYFTTSQKGEDGEQAKVTFSATVDLSNAAYSGRFQPAGAGTVTP
jgi:hypothetical protein